MPPVWTILLLAASPTSASLQPGVLAWDSVRVWGGLALAFSLFGGVYVFNQVFDIESDRVNRKLLFLPEGILSRRSALVQYLVFTIAALVAGAFLGRIWFLTTVAVTVLGVLYSLPPVRLKDRPLGGLLANAIGHGTLVYYLGRALADPQRAPDWGSSVSYAFAVAGVYLLTTIPDREGDQATGKRTLSVRFGPRPTAITATVCVLVSGAVGVGYGQWPLVVSAALSLPFFAVSVIAERLCAAAVRVALLSLSFFACLAFWPYIFVLVVIWTSTRWYYRRRFGIVYPRLGGG